jgi:hypothetical protein
VRSLLVQNKHPRHGHGSLADQLSVRSVHTLSETCAHCTHVTDQQQTVCLRQKGELQPVGASQTKLHCWSVSHASRLAKTDQGWPRLAMCSRHHAGSEMWDATSMGCDALWSSPSNVVALVTNAVLEAEPCSIALASPLRGRERVLDHVLATVVTPQVGHGSARLWSTLSAQQPLWCRSAVRANAAAANGRN